VPIFITIALFVFILLAITGFGYLIFVKPSNVLRQLEAMTSSLSPEDSFPSVSAGGWTVVSSLQWIGQKVPVSPEQSSFTRKELASAGFRGDNAEAVFVGIRIGMVAIVTLLAFIFRHQLVANNMLSLVMVGLSAVGSYLLVGIGLDHLVDARREKLKLSLPDALDLLVVCVEAGQGLDQAIRVVSRELRFTHKDLSEEFSLACLEMQAGKSRTEAITHMAERTGESEMRKLASVLVQTDRFGTSVGEALRTHSDYLRVRRGQEAEERAHKVGVKLIFPIFFFIMPSIMIVSAGPGMLMLFRQLGAIARDMR
jgi:tight adherence protein C